jgi:hypothetical protein
MAASEPCAPEWDRRKSIKLGFCAQLGKVIENGFRTSINSPLSSKNKSATRLAALSLICDLS